MSFRIVIGLTLTIVITITIVSIWFMSPQEHFRPENTSWNGLRELQEDYNLVPLPSETLTKGLSGNNIVLSIPYREPTVQDVAELKSYVESGGVLIIADDHGFGNTILSGLGISARFHGGSLIDPLFNLGDNGFLIINDIEPSLLTTNVSSLALNYATGLKIETGTIVANSSSFSFMDLDLDGFQDEQEPTGPFPVIAHIGIGEGELILISDPSIFINAMVHTESNPDFISNIFGSAGPEARIYLHIDHLPNSFLIQSKEQLVGIRNKSSGPTSLIVITAISSLIWFYPIWRKEGVTNG